MAETIPWVTVNSSPKGFPMAMAFCPTRIVSESPRTKGTRRSLGASTLRGATSRGGAAPTSRAWYSLGSLWNFTVLRSAPSTTW